MAMISLAIILFLSPPMAPMLLSVKKAQGSSLRANIMAACWMETMMYCSGLPVSFWIAAESSRMVSLAVTASTGTVGGVLVAVGE